MKLPRESPAHSQNGSRNQRPRTTRPRQRGEDLRTSEALTSEVLISKVRMDGVLIRNGAAPLRGAVHTGRLVGSSRKSNPDSQPLDLTTRDPYWQERQCGCRAWQLEEQPSHGEATDPLPVAALATS